MVNKLIGLHRRTKRALQLVVDSLLILACFVAAMFLRLESFAFLAVPEIWAALLPVVPLTLIVFVRLGLYRSIVRFITGRVMVVVAGGALLSAGMLFVAAQSLPAPIPRSVPGIYAILLFLAVGGIRFVVRRVMRSPQQQNRKRIAIYGAGGAGRQLLNAVYHGTEFMPVAFLDDDPALQHTIVAGRRVFAPAQAAHLVGEMQVDVIMLAIPSASRARRREIVARLEPLGVQIKMMPSMEDVISGRADLNELRLVTPEDLLGRDPVPARPELMGQNITGKVVMVTGAGGSIGSELCRQIIQHQPAALVLFEVSEFGLYQITNELRELCARTGSTPHLEPILGSVQDAGRVRAALRSFGVQTVYHAAAYKHVVLVEENVIEGIRNNVFGTQTMAEAAVALGVEDFILISTDKAVRPTNFMGASKRMAELVCQARAQGQNRTRFSMVRFGNVLGSSGSVIPRFRAQIEQGGPVTVTHPEITRYFMTIPEAAQLVIQAGAMAKGGDVFVLDMGEPVKILDLAQSMIRLHGLRPYMLDMGEQHDAARGDIGIRIVGLNKGEKLYEELLIGDNPRGTDHPRILTATEVALTQAEMDAFLDRLQRACQSSDMTAIRRIFLDAPLAFRPNGDAIHDLVWNAAQTQRQAEPQLRLIAQET